MSYLFHIIFVLLKIIGLGYIYSTLTILTFKYLSRQSSDNWFKRTLQDFPKLKTYFRLIYSIGLFVFMFTHWGDHGLGDTSRLPLSYGREIGNIDGTNTYIPNTDNGRSDINMEHFAITDDFVCGEVLGDTIDYAGKYFVFNMETNHIFFLKDRSKYEKYALENNLPNVDKFKDFFYHYSKYWNTWRFFLLA